MPKYNPVTFPPAALRELRGLSEESYYNIMFAAYSIYRYPLQIKEWDVTVDPLEFDDLDVLRRVLLNMSVERR